MTDWQTQRARELRSNMTDAERKLWNVLRDRQVDQFKFRRQMPIGRYVADFVCPTARLVIEVDGGRQGTATDADRDRWFTDNGFRVLRFWNNEVERNLEGVYQRVQEVLFATPAPVASPAPAPAAPAAGVESSPRPAVSQQPGSTSAPASAPSNSPAGNETDSSEAVLADASASMKPADADVPPAAKTAPAPAPAPVAKAPDDDSPWARARREREATARVLQTGGDGGKVASPHAHASEQPESPPPVPVSEKTIRVPPPPIQVQPPKPAATESPWQAKPSHVDVPPKSPNPPRQPATTVETRIHGLNACLAAFAARPHDLRKVYLLQSRLGLLRDVLAWCVQHRLGYRVVEEADLAKLAGSAHHEGMCFDMLRKAQPDLPALLAQLPSAQPACLLWLDGVGNPHNFGAVLRSAAHFGVAGVLLPPDSPLTLSGAAYRVAEGGAEAVAVVKLDSIEAATTALTAAGFTLAATLPRAAESIYAAELPPRTVFVLGAEGAGMQVALIEACTLRVNIPGTGRVESLNIANAVGVLLSEHWRRHAL